MEDWHEAWRQDCETVGLATPSTDLAEIKRAYAKTLRKTRPDDDAQAYQALREAYDRLLAHARWQQAHGTPEVTQVEKVAQDTPGVDRRAEARDSGAGDDGFADTMAFADTTAFDDTTGAADEDASVDTAASAGDALPDTVPAWRSPSELRDWLLALRPLGPVALERALPELRAALEALPLETHAQASVEFADMILATRAGLPPLVVEFLRVHFGWDGDFRAERLLGSQRMAALADLLQGIPRPVTDPEQRREFGPVARLARMAGPGGNRNRARLLTLLTGYALQVRLHRAGPWLLRRLGVEPADRQGLERLIAELPVVQTVLGMLAGFVMAMVAGLVWNDAFLAALAIPVGAVVATVVCYGVQVGHVVAHRVVGAPVSRLVSRVLPARWSRTWSRAWPWVGVVAILAAGALGQYGEAVADWAPLATMALAVAGLMLALPAEAAGIAAVVLPCLLVELLGPHALSPLARSFLWAWVLAGALVFHQELYVPNRTLHDLPRRPDGGARAVAALATVGLPTLIAWLTAQCGLRFTLALFAMTAMVGALIPRHSPHLVWALPLAFGAWLALLLAIKRAGWRLGLRLLGDDPAR